MIDYFIKFLWYYIIFMWIFFLIVIFGLFLPYENVCLKKKAMIHEEGHERKEIERYSIINTGGPQLSGPRSP